MPEPKPIRILFAEDEPLLRELMSKQLRAGGYPVEAVQTGDEALAAVLSGNAADILLTDISMPGTLDGWALAEYCRRLHPQLGVIYATAEPQDPAKQLANSFFIAKPYRVDDILAALRQIAAPDTGSPAILAKTENLALPGSSCPQCSSDSG